MEERAAALEGAYVSDPTPDGYAAWQQGLRGLLVLRMEATEKAMVHSAQQIFEHGNKNGRLLAWLARGQSLTTPVGSIRLRGGELVSSPDHVNTRFA